MKSTGDYRKRSDKVGEFIDDCLQKSEKKAIKAGDVYAAYQSWCRESGYGAEGKQNFYGDLRKRGLFADRGTVDGKTVKNIIPGYELAPTIMI